MMMRKVTVVPKQYTAAVAAVADAAGVPWAALRAVTDRASGLALGAFLQHFPTQAGRAADTLEELLQSDP